MLTALAGTTLERGRMRCADDPTQAACDEIEAELCAPHAITEGRVRAAIRRAAARHSLARIPANDEIIARAPSLRAALLKRPVRTASGVAVVALMPAPYACPHGRCTYCPGGAESKTPNSYTGREPISEAAIGAGYEPRAQIRARLARLASYGHDTSKAELVIVGGTFLFMPAEYRERFVRSCYEELNGSASASLRGAQHANESARTRCVGLTIETKPDYCREAHVDSMLEYGATRVEIGVQCLRERVYRSVNRGHTYADVVSAFRISRDAGYKTVAHMMPALPGMSPDDDAEDLARLWSDPDLRPDMLKIYPSLVIRGTPLYDEYAAGRYAPYADGELVRMLARAKARVPRWARIMRIAREISPSEIVAGYRRGNLRQAVHAQMRRDGTACRCIRCREAGLAGAAALPEGGVSLRRDAYDAGGGRELFFSLEDDAERVYAYLRLRAPSDSAHRRELAGGACIVRELHVVGRPAPVGSRRGALIQHSGLGERLVREAERAAREELGARRLLVISAVGTRTYYARLGYSRRGAYMSRDLR